MRSGDDTALGVIRAEFTRVVGESNETSELQQLAKVDVHDIDGWSSNDEIALPKEPALVLLGFSTSESHNVRGLP